MSRSAPLEQQGFCPERRIHAAYTALHAIIERERIGGTQNGGGRISAAFVDVKKAFHSVRRCILWHKLASENMASADSLPFDVGRLIRALIALYSNASATARGDDGYSSSFGIESGTRGWRGKPVVVCSFCS